MIEGYGDKVYKFGYEFFECRNSAQNSPDRSNFNFYCVGEESIGYGVNFEIRVLQKITRKLCNVKNMKFNHL